MDRTLRLGHTLQFYSIPLPFEGIRKVNLSSQKVIDFLSLEIWDALSSDCMTGKIGFTLLSSWFPRRLGGSDPFWISTNRCIAHKLLELLQSANWFTTIELKNTHFHVKVAPKYRKFLHITFQKTAYEHNRHQFGYSLAPRIFSSCVNTALQPLCEGLLLSQQPHCYGRVQGVGRVPHSPVDLASILAGIYNQLEEEQSPTSPTGGEFGGRTTTTNYY